MQNNTKKLSIAAMAALLLIGCQDSGEMSKTDEAKLKQGFTQGADPSKMSDSEKKGFDEYMKTRGGAAASKSGN